MWRGVVAPNKSPKPHGGGLFGIPTLRFDGKATGIFGAWTESREGAAGCIPLACIEETAMISATLAITPTSVTLVSGGKQFAALTFAAEGGATPQFAAHAANCVLSYLTSYLAYKDIAAGKVVVEIDNEVDLPSGWKAREVLVVTKFSEAATARHAAALAARPPRQATKPTPPASAPASAPWDEDGPEE